MSTDRELLELAAKAAGVCIIRSRLDDPACRDMLVKDSQRNPSNVMGQWNPLTDDGDALRLAVKLELHIGKAAQARQRFSGRHDFEMPGSSIYEFEDNDPYAATRRAIVRAAAEIGKSSHD